MIDSWQLWLVNSLVFGGAFALCAALVPPVRHFAIMANLVDKPDPNRKLHGRIVSLGGGIAVFLSTLIVSTILMLSANRLGWLSGETLRDLVGLLVASVIIVLVGIVDDKYALRGRQKLLGQILAAAIVAVGGTTIGQITCLGFQFQLGSLAIPATMIWLLAAINAINLLDGADGMASTVGSIISAGLGATAILQGNYIDGWIALAMSAALLGFLIYNAPPASIFLGDTGSMLIGLVVGTLAIRSSLKESTTVSMLAPLAILAIPFFDSFVAILRRRLTGRSIYSTDRGHLHHILQRRGLSPLRLLIVVATLCGITTGVAVLSVVSNRDWIAMVGAALVLAGLVGLKIFGAAELSMLIQKLTQLGNSFLVRSQNSDSVVRQHMVRLQGSRQWETAWHTLVEFAERHDLGKVSLDLNVAWLHEGFHASWRRDRLPDKADQWTMRLPIASGGRMIGYLDAVGKSNGSIAPCEQIGMLSDLITDLLPTFDRIVTGDVSGVASHSIPRPVAPSAIPAEEPGLVLTRT